MANTVEDFTTAHDKSQLLRDKQSAIDELTVWNTDITNDDVTISAKLLKTLNGGGVTALFLDDPPFVLQTSLKTPIQAAITARIAELNIEIETLKDEIEALIVP